MSAHTAATGHVEDETSSDWIEYATGERIVNGGRLATANRNLPKPLTGLLGVDDSEGAVRLSLVRFIKIKSITEVAGKPACPVIIMIAYQYRRTIS